MLTLMIANKKYSSWSLRPWLLLKYFKVLFEEQMILLDRPDTKEKIFRASPTGKVPVLIDGEIKVWETLAIMEYINDTLDIPVWPEDKKPRALARALAAEMHAGFMGFRSACPMNFGKKYAYRDRGHKVNQDVERICSLIREERSLYGKQGSFLFGDFSAVDAMYVPVLSRLETYSFPLSEDVLNYQKTMLALPAYQEWQDAARKEPWIVAEDEVDDIPLVDYMKS